ncbi:hypothetical protein BU17DRAFT_94200 [Hysterangium stoloniferum]|nr:hypothetical protein BU17DRAFT_94200 [Hysterangium stoloniferum]
MDITIGNLPSSTSTSILLAQFQPLPYNIPLYTHPYHVLLLFFVQVLFISFYQVIAADNQTSFFQGFPCLLHVPAASSKVKLNMSSITPSFSTTMTTLSTPVLPPIFMHATASLFIE